MEGYQGGQRPGGHALQGMVKGAVLVEPGEEAAMGRSNSLQLLESKLWRR